MPTHIFPLGQPWRHFESFDTIFLYEMSFFKEFLARQRMENRRSSGYQFLHKNQRPLYFYDYLWYLGDIYEW